MKLSVVIVSYNVRFYLSQCIDSVRRSMDGIEGEIFVVDNCSNDDTETWICERYPDVHYIGNKDNVGFAKANNQALRLAQGEYVVLLNPDTIVGENVLREVISVMDREQNAGGAGVMMLKQDGGFALESRRGVPTPFTSFCKMTGLCKLFPKSRTFGGYYMQYLDREKIADIEIISGACMFIRRSVLDEAGLLDETFFMYGEDIDLSYRLLNTGKRNLYIPSAILHYKGESTKKNSFRYVNAFYQAMLIFFEKHYGGYSKMLSVPIKGAIYLKGFADYLWQQCKVMIDKHDTLYYIQKSRFLLIGGSRNMERMIGKCEAKGIIYDSVVASQDIIESGHTSLTDMGRDYDYIVYDMDVFRYETVLEAFRQTGNKKPSPMIATYHSDGDVIITGSMVF